MWFFFTLSDQFKGEAICIVVVFEWILEGNELLIIFFDVVKITVEESFVLIKFPMKLLLLQLDLPLKFLSQQLQFNIQLHLHVVNATVQLLK